MSKGEVVLVTGANGYIGRHVVDELIRADYRVIAVDRSKEDLDPKASFFARDVFGEIDDLLEVSDVLIHLAWRNGFNHSHFSHIEDLPLHVDLLRRAVDRNVKKIAVMGSMHEIGYWEGKVDSATPCNPMSFYGVSKNALRELAEIICQNSQTRLFWLRGYYLVGDNSRAQSIFAKIDQAAKRGDCSFPLNSGKNKYDFLSITEAARQIVAIVGQEKYTGIINVCSGTSVALGEYVSDYIESKGYELDIDFDAFPDRPYDSPEIFGDSTVIDSIMNDRL
ncbi:NAD(P)-dependent oxidoreductase [Adlercreutzia sp. ZJ473]|uniref:NAD-dependent epimerase/dehydratase family protein n=1 Tax=Adlercreutzia sp. ZJ473 TaxID=2722822 RepID=UPI00155830C1|nr:NAD(P)-dependent oxidoreductase [Adlercreutzia sp. ZJ473]